MLIALRQLVVRVVWLTEGLARITNWHCYAGASIIGQLASHRWHHFRQGPGIVHITSATVVVRSSTVARGTVRC